ncbi:tRNA pseudouridine(55) synthase TruB [filamentous cyanobacterium LEGE 11480]|uniref:tRNA pseudouridine synthase B n=1 Tax=Romeriopsis navalis LEGE 11480 TaxID=2777977 RepID=A0A928VP77_9CYAN|nr:tRNA pseudouridine(55) synthase TruB [Romeriopsis navalis]MBE9032151.1 tRNA pseudouridine(55) synthase TruB [Romeriopsis navalis LEGE 11480]
MDGFLNLNKPLGFTSHDCVAKLRRILGTKKIGHAGTLDPAASGVLPIAVGRVTRLLQYLPSQKAYQATVRFGITTDSDDLEGQVLTELAAPQLVQDAVVQALPQFQGHIQQVPPAFSAIQVDGQRLYALARAGKVVDVPMREVDVYSIEVLAWRSGEFPEIDLAISCGAGTYIRSIARDLGEAVGTGATLAALCRTFSSGFGFDQSLTFEQVTESASDGTLQLASPIVALTGLDKIELSDELARRWCFGQKIEVESLSLASPQPEVAYRVHNAAQDFLGITKVEPIASGWRCLPQMVYQHNG